MEPASITAIVAAITSACVVIIDKVSSRLKDSNFNHFKSKCCFGAVNVDLENNTA